MNDLVFNLLTHRRLERIRGMVPYPLYTGLLTFVLALPLMIPMVLSERSPLGRSPLPFPVRWLAAASIPAGVILVMMSGLALIGFISGHRPFRHRWARLTPRDAAELLGRLQAVARWMGFDVMWSDARKGFVGVLNMEAEAAQGFHDSDKAPVRIVVRVRGMEGLAVEVRLKLQIRTLVVWDTGEKARLADMGQRMLAQLSPPPVMPGGAP